MGAQKSRADFFEIVFIGPGPATMLILAVGVMAGSGQMSRSRKKDETAKRNQEKQ